MNLKKPRSRSIYRFGSQGVDGDGRMQQELGGKGAGLAEMTKLGVPVPPGFTISTSVCRFFLEYGTTPEGFNEELEDAIAWLELEQGQGFGNEESPLLVSVRSGAPVSMPGMMDTILNVGINDANVSGLAAKHQSMRFALDSYRRLLQMFGSVVLLLPKAAFDGAMEDAKHGSDQQLDSEFDEVALRRMVASFHEIIERHTGHTFPMDPRAQLRQAVDAVFHSWNNERARHYRRLGGAAVGGTAGGDAESGAVSDACRAGTAARVVAAARSGRVVGRYRLAARARRRL